MIKQIITIIILLYLYLLKARYFGPNLGVSEYLIIWAQSNYFSKIAVKKRIRLLMFYSSLTNGK